MKKTMELSQEALEAIKTQASARLEAYWNEHASEEEKKAATERGATITGAYAFIEDFARRGATGGCACIPDAVVYELLGVFMRTAKDGDTYATPEEIRADEEHTAKEEQEKAERTAKAKAEAVKTEQAKVEAMSEEKRKAYEAERAEREAKEAEAKAERDRKEAERKAKAEEKARKKALAEELAKRQLCFNF